MKGLLKRSFYNLLRPQILIILSLFIGLNIGVPISIGAAYSPNIEYTSLFGFRQDISSSLVMFLLFGFIFIMLHFLTAIVLFIPIRMMEKDKISNWTMFLATTPVKRRSYVTEKYFFTFLLIEVLSLSCSVSFGIMDLIKSKTYVAQQLAKSMFHGTTMQNTNACFDIKVCLLSFAFLQGIYLMVWACVYLAEFFVVSKKEKNSTIKLVSFIITVVLVSITTVSLLKINTISPIDDFIMALFVLAFSWGVYIFSLLISRQKNMNILKR